MHLHIYKSVRTDIEGFVQFWSQRYSYPEPQLYDNNIDRELCELTEEQFLDLFRWKNRMRLSEAKESSVQENFIKRRDQLEQFYQKPDDTKTVCQKID